VSDHRPLSDWVAFAETAIGEPVPERSLSPVNRGVERLDARALPEFEAGWSRVGASILPHSDRIEPPDRPYLALALASPSGEIAVELDDRGRPLVIGERAIAIIDAIEEEWPLSSLGEEAIDALETEGPDLRFLLVDRLAREGEPEDGLFWLLPWGLFVGLAASVASMLDGGEVSRPPRVGHFLAPLGEASLSAPIEQMAAGLRTDQPDLVRKGAGSLAAAVLLVRLDRVPPYARDALVEVLERALAFDPVLGWMVERALRSLRHEEWTTPQLQGELALAAADLGERVVVATHPGPVELEVVRTANRMLLSVAVQMGDDHDPAQVLDRLYGGRSFLPVEIARLGDDTSVTYWVPLFAGAEILEGSIEVAPPLDTVELIVGPAAGAVEAAELGDAARRRSFEAADRRGEAAWNALDPGTRRAEPTDGE
jgi:hypothetical protein